MENQTTAPAEQSEQPKDVAQPEATPEVKETVLAEPTTEQKTEEPTVVNFKELIPEEYKEEKALANFSTMNDFVKSYLNAQRLVGANKVAIPNKMATDDDWQEVFDKLGRPKSPEDYKYDVKEGEIKSPPSTPFIIAVLFKISLDPKPIATFSGLTPFNFAINSLNSVKAARIVYNLDSVKAFLIARLAISEGP